MKTSLCGAIRFGFVLVLGAGTASASTTLGGMEEVASDVAHPNGNVYDQVLLSGPIGTVRADPGQVTRVSFVDLTDDIVQVEFSGKGSLTISLENATGPMPAVKYNQPDVQYMRGHATISISGSDASTNIAVFSVGRVTAFSQNLFRDDVTYDGFADIASIQIVPSQESPGGDASFGSIRAGNTHFSATQGYTGIYAPGINVQGPVIVSDVTAYGDATPVLWFGEASRFGSVTLAGGDLAQHNTRGVQMSGFQSIVMSAGASSLGAILPTQLNQGRVERDGGDVTRSVVIYLVPVAFSSPPATGASSVTVTPPVVSAALGAVGVTAPVPSSGPAVPNAPSVIVRPDGG